LEFGIAVGVLSQQPRSQGALFADQPAARPTHPVQNAAQPDRVLITDLDQPVDGLGRGRAAAPQSEQPGQAASERPVRRRLPIGRCSPRLIARRAAGMR
jgi:hypothetical protein